jgi:hypothetical protein
VSNPVTSTDRIFLKHFAMLIGFLAIVAIVLMALGAHIYASHPPETSPKAQATVGARIAPVGAVYAGDTRLNTPRALPPGPIPVPGAEVRVLALSDALPSRIEVRFTDDPASSCFVVEAPDGAVTRIALPAVGAETRL